MIQLAAPASCRCSDTPESLSPSHSKSIGQSAFWSNHVSEAKSSESSESALPLKGLLIQKAKKTDPNRDLWHAIAQEISRLRDSRNRVACSSIRFNSASGIWPCNSSHTAKAARTSVCRRSVTACSLVKEPFSMRVSIKPPCSTIPKAANCPLISGSLVGNRSNCSGVAISSLPVEVVALVVVPEALAVQWAHLEAFLISEHRLAVVGLAFQPLFSGGGGGGVGGTVGTLGNFPVLSSLSGRGGSGAGGWSRRSDIINLSYLKLALGKSTRSSSSLSRSTRAIQDFTLGNCGACFSASNHLSVSSSKLFSTGPSSASCLNPYHTLTSRIYTVSSSNDTLRNLCSFFRNGMYGRATATTCATPITMAQILLCCCHNDHAATLAEVQRANPIDKIRSYSSALRAHSQAYNALNFTSTSRYQIRSRREPDSMGSDKLFIPIFCFLIVVVCFVISGLPFDLFEWWSNRRKR